MSNCLKHPPPCRYPSDQYDRFWDPYNSTYEGANYSDVAATSKTQTFRPASSTLVYDTPPDSVLRTALTHPTLINYTYYLPTTVREAYLSVSFAEIRSTAELAGSS